MNSNGNDNRDAAWFELIKQGVEEGVADQVASLISSQVLSYEDLTDQVKQELKSISAAVMTNVMEEMNETDISHIKNKSAYMLGVLRSNKKKTAVEQASISGPEIDQLITYGKRVDSTNALGPNAEAIKAIVLRLGYRLDITTGQRQLAPLDHGNEPPGKGCEVFIGGLLREMLEDSLVPMLEECGTIKDLRIMTTDQGLNKGFGFCVFSSKEEAQKAVRTLNGKQMNRNRQLKVNVHSPNVRLFVGGVDKKKDKDEIYEALQVVTDGVVDVILKPDVSGQSLHRGFVFVDFIDHKHASLALRKLGLPTTKVFNRNLFAEWAEPQAEVSDEIMSTVKVLYVTGLSATVTEETLRDRFSPYGDIENVKKIKDYAFIHFTERENALQAMNDLNGQKIEDGCIEVTLAKPLSSGKSKTGPGREGPPGGPRGVGGGGRFGDGGRGGGMSAMRGGRGAPRGGMRGGLASERRPPPPLLGGRGRARLPIDRYPPAVAAYDDYPPPVARRPLPPAAPRYADPYDDPYGIPRARPAPAAALGRSRADPYDPYGAAPAPSPYDDYPRSAAPGFAERRGVPRGAVTSRPLLGAGSKRPYGEPVGPDYAQADSYGRPASGAYGGAPSAYPDVYGQHPRPSAGGPPEAKKSKPLLDWDVKPIAQQPLRSAGQMFGASRGESAWYQDSY